MRLATGSRPGDPKVLTVISAFVDDCPTKADAYRAGKAAMISDRRAPDYPVHAEDLGYGRWEVLFTERPLAPGTTFINGARVATMGAKRYG